jgi:putative ABC transport system permease protein
MTHNAGLQRCAHTGTVLVDTASSPHSFLTRMLQSYLKIALRTLLRHKGYTFINIFGLALSMSVSLLIIVLVQDQFSYDRFHEHADRVYRVIADRHEPDGDVGILAATPAFLGPAIERDVPGIAETVRLAELNTNVIHEGKSLNVSGIYAEPTFFDVFSFELIQGDPEEALAGPNKVILSEATAARIFGEAAPLGQNLTLEGAGDFTVSGIVATDGVKSHLKFDVVSSFATLETLSYGRERLDQEVSFDYFATYLLLEENANLPRLEAYLNQVSLRYENRQDSYLYRLKLQPLTGITLGPGQINEISSHTLPLYAVLPLAGIALVVMLAAGFNYIGLTIARSLQRAKEIGVRKTAGAHRRQVMFQFLAESVLLTLAALVLAYVLLTWLVPRFNSLVVMQAYDIRFSVLDIYDLRLAGLFIAFSLIVGLLAGLYPAWYLSKLDPVQTLKGNSLGRGATRMRLRKALVTAQLVFSLIFIITGVLIYRQFEYIVGFDYGFRTADVLNVDLQGVPPMQLRDELLRHPGVLSVAAVSEPPATGNGSSTRIVGNGSDTLGVTFYSIDEHFLNSLDVELLAGSNLPQEGSGKEVLINATAVSRLGFETPQQAVGQAIYFTSLAEEIGMDSGQFSIVGVVEEYQFRTSLEAAGPMLLYRNEDFFSNVLVRIHPEQAAQVVAHLEAVWKQIAPLHPLDYAFLDTQLRLEDEGIRFFGDLMKVVGLASFIAVVIACLGLLAMAAFSAQLRTKEVGIRKVLGATVSGIAWLLSREFLLLIPVALAIAIPLAWFGNNLWLQQIANHTSFGFSIVMAGTALLVLLALAAIGTQAVRASLADPVKSLRYE